MSKPIKFLIIVIVTLAFSLVLMSGTGCKTLSRYLFEPYTNVISQVVIPISTNAQGVVTYQTNDVVETGMRPNTNANSLAQGAGTVANTFFPGTGGLVTAGTSALIGALAGFFGGRKFAKKK